MREKTFAGEEREDGMLRRQDFLGSEGGRLDTALREEDGTHVRGPVRRRSPCGECDQDLLLERPRGDGVHIRMLQDDLREIPRPLEAGVGLGCRRQRMRDLTAQDPEIQMQCDSATLRGTDGSGSFVFFEGRVHVPAEDSTELRDSSLSHEQSHVTVDPSEIHSGDGADSGDRSALRCVRRCKDGWWEGGRAGGEQAGEEKGKTDERRELTVVSRHIHLIPNLSVHSDRQGQEAEEKH